MKSILMSIRPEWCELIASGKKTIEVRKTRPKIETPFKCYIYCTNNPPYLVYGTRFNGYRHVAEYYMELGCSREEADEIWGVLNGKVIGEFVCDEVYSYPYYDAGFFEIYEISYEEKNEACLTMDDLEEYGKGKTLYGWHISDLIIYDEPKELREFKRPCSWKSKICTGGCKRLVVDGNNDIRCADAIEHAPQSWCYVEQKWMER